MKKFIVLFGLFLLANLCEAQFKMSGYSYVDKLHLLEKKTQELIISEGGVGFTYKKVEFRYNDIIMYLYFVSDNEGYFFDVMTLTNTKTIYQTNPDRYEKPTLPLSEKEFRLTYGQTRLNHNLKRKIVDIDDRTNSNILIVNMSDGSNLRYDFISCRKGEVYTCDGGYKHMRKYFNIYYVHDGSKSYGFSNENKFYENYCDLTDKEKTYYHACAEHKNNLEICLH